MVGTVDGVQVDGSHLNTEAFPEKLPLTLLKGEPMTIESPRFDKATDVPLPNACPICFDDKKSSSYKNTLVDSTALPMAMILASLDNEI